MDARDEVKSRLSIEDVIGRYLELKKSGRNFKALSPFTKEKTASFIVSPEKQIWHDFSSGRGGDVFSFIMEVEGLDFKDALELLARRAGVDLEKYQKGRRGDISKARLYEINELAAKFYQVQFKANEVAYSYVLKDRQFTKATALAWQIGYSPSSGDSLYKFLKTKGYSDQEIKLSGLITTRYSRPVDMFRGRLMIPLADSQGRVIGFTARTLDPKDKGPKYINTPQTVLYDKSRHIFGLHLAKEAIRSEGHVVVVEGNLDVIGSYQAGVRQVVATAGTALTREHLKALGLLTKDIRLCFDADKAGLNATERAIPLASEQDLNISVITLPTGKDPDELAKSNKRAWQETVSKPTYAIDWLIEHYQKNMDLSSAQGKREFSDLLLPIIRSLSDDVEKDHYFNVLSKLLKVSASALSSKSASIKSSQPQTRLPMKVKATPLDKDSLERIKTENNFLSLLLVHKKLRRMLGILSTEMFIADDAKELFSLLSNNPDTDVKKDVASFRKIEDYVKIELLLYEELYAKLDLQELGYEASRLKTRLVESYIRNQKKIITAKLNGADSMSARKLLEKVKTLDSLLNQVKGEDNLYAKETGSTSR